MNKLKLIGECPKCGNDGNGNHLLGYGDPKFIAQRDETNHNMIAVDNFCTQCKAGWTEYYSFDNWEPDEERGEK
ncbi:MAG: hypothetical protein C0391_03820 [Anaerolinea sp.]|nr:hypothetical protein [Anaerolinea sp.]